MYVSDYYRREIVTAVSSLITKESDSQILGSNLEQLADYYFDQVALQPLEVDPANPSSAEHQKYFRRISAGERDGPYQFQGDIPEFQCERVIVEVPILSNPHYSLIATLNGATMSVSYSASEFIWEERQIRYVIETKGYRFEMTPDEIAREVTGALGRIHEMLRWRNESITSENTALRLTIRQLIEARRQSISSDAAKLAELTKKIPVALKRKEIGGARPVPLVQRPLVKRLKPTASVPVEYVLDPDRVNDVITYLDNQAKSFESASKEIRDLGEEALRDVLLSNLNSVMQGSATGETFSRNGKTDIYLRIDQGNILVCECKVWNGAQLYQTTINQLRGYLTWRHNFGIMITFVRAKGFTRVIEEAGKAIQSDPSYVGGFRTANATHLVSNHRVDDEKKDVIVHHLFYHLP